MVMYMYEILKQFRKVNNYTCSDMAKMLKISISYYCQIENGKRKLDYIMAVKISSIFKMYPDDIFYDNHLNDKIILKRNTKKIRTYSFMQEE